MTEDKNKVLVEQGQEPVVGKERNQALFYGALLLFVAAFWGVGNPVLKIVTAVMPPLYCLAIRFFISFACYMMIFHKKVIANLKKENIKPSIMMSLPIAATYICSAYAMRFTTATNAGFFTATAVIFTPILGYIFLKSKIDIKTLLSIVIVVAGMFLLSTATGTIKVNPGDMIAVLCALTGAFMFIVAKFYVHDIDPIFLTVMQIGLAGIWCLLAAFVFETFPGFVVMDGNMWGAMLFMSVFCTCVSFVIQNVSLKHVSETYVALIFCMEPVFGAVAAYFMLAERLNTKGLIGAAVIMIGVVAASLTAKEEEGEHD